MEIEQLFTRIKDGDISEEERMQLVAQVQADVAAIKEKEPERYLAFLKELNAMIESLNKELEAI